MKPNPFQGLPEHVKINGRPVPVNTDFRAGIAIELESMERQPDIAGLLNVFYLGKVPSDVVSAAGEMLAFYSYCDRRGAGKKTGDAPVRQRNRVYDFSQDADALLSSFLDAYGLDLSTAKIHWWTFKRLLCNLPPETPFMRRIYYRTADLNKMGRSERKHAEKMRRLYALKAPERAGKSAEELDQEFLERTRRRYEEARQKSGVSR